MGAKDQGAGAIKGRWLTIPRTLCFVTHGADVLLLKRAPEKRVFPNKYNGLGGHIERGEDVRSGALREITEESGLSVDHVLFCGCTHIDAGQPTGIMLFVFRAEATSRTLASTPEGELAWVPQAQVMAYDLVEDLPVILPRVLAMPFDAPPFFAIVHYNEHDQIQVRFAGET